VPQRLIYFGFGTPGDRVGCSGSGAEGSAARPVEVPLAERLVERSRWVGRRSRGGSRLGAARAEASAGARKEGECPTPASTPHPAATATSKSTPFPTSTPRGLAATRAQTAPRPRSERSRRTSFNEARDAARRGETEFAEQLAREVAERHMCPESYLLVAMAADARGDLGGAIDALRRALYLEPGLAMAHAALVPLYARTGRHDEAARARRNALEAVAGLDDGAPLRGVEPITAGALRSALGDPHRTHARAGRSET
jgi:chemotaxis protein methyltransferase CheR